MVCCHLNVGQFSYFHSHKIFKLSIYRKNIVKYWVKHSGTPWEPAKPLLYPDSCYKQPMDLEGLLKINRMFSTIFIKNKVSLKKYVHKMTFKLWMCLFLSKITTFFWSKKVRKTSLFDNGNFQLFLSTATRENDKQNV